MKRTLMGCIVGAALAFGGSVGAQDNMMPFGTDTEVNYAAQLWTAMESINMVGDGMLRTFPYEGIAPHGMMLETFYTKATVGGHTGTLLVKRNYGPEGVTEDEVLKEPGKHLGAITVMFKREAGYDADNQDWFWAKYLPDGSLDKNPKGMQLAGRVAKGKPKGCIACHSGAPGGDYIFTTDHLK